jgi:hypothetical protein
VKRNSKEIGGKANFFEPQERKWRVLGDFCNRWM